MEVKHELLISSFEDKKNNREIIYLELEIIYTSEEDEMASTLITKSLFIGKNVLDKVIKG